MQTQLILILLVAVILILVTLQNPNPVSLQFLSWQAEQVPLIVIILMSLLVGIIICSVLSLIKQSKLKARIYSLQKEIEELKSPPVIHRNEEVKE